MDILNSPAVEALLPALLGGAGAALSSPKLAGSRGAVGRGLMGAGEGLAGGMQTAQQQQRLNMEQQQQPLKMDELSAQVQGLQQQQKMNGIVLSNEEAKRAYGLNIKDPTDQARYFADPKSYLERDLAVKAVPASLAALRYTGVQESDMGAFKEIAKSDPAMLHDIAAKAAEAHAAGKETDFQKQVDAYVGAGMSRVAAGKQAAMDLKAAPQIAVTEARGAEARATKATAPAPAPPAGGQAAVNDKAMDSARKTYEANFKEVNESWAKNLPLIKMMHPDEPAAWKGPPSFEEWSKGEPGQDALKNAGYKELDATPAPAAPKPADKPAAASPGPSDSKGKTPPKEESTPHGLAKFDESKSKKAGKAIYVAPDGTVWG
jgi:hypothetical protein